MKQKEHTGTFFLFIINFKKKDSTVLTLISPSLSLIFPSPLAAASLTRILYAFLCLLHCFGRFVFCLFVFFQVTGGRTRDYWCLIVIRLHLGEFEKFSNSIVSYLLSICGVHSKNSLSSLGGAWAKMPVSWKKSMPTSKQSLVQVAV